MTAIGILTGLASEARLIRRAIAHDAIVPVIGCAGADEDSARHACRRFLDHDVRMLVSFGLAGGLAEALRPGTLVIPDRILMSDGHMAATAQGCTRGLMKAAEAARLTAVSGTLAGVRAPITSAAEKRALGQRTGAVAVDMESHVLAAFAHDSGLPFVVIRAIADPADMDLPPALTDLVAPGGRIRVGRCAARLALGSLHPSSMWQTYHCARAAMVSLRRLMRAAGGLLSDEDL